MLVLAPTLSRGCNYRILGGFRMNTRRSNEQIINDFIRGLQWDLRASYNSSSCLNSKQRDFLETKLWDLLEELENLD